MKKILNKFLNSVLIIFAVILSWIILMGLLEYSKVIWEFNPIILIAGIVGYIVGVLLFYKYILSKIEKFKYIEYPMFLIFIVGAVFSSLYFKLTPTWDMGATFDIAKEYVEQGTYTNTFYLSQFPNNIMMTVVNIVILKFMNLVGIKDLLSGISVVTALIISASVIISFYIVKRILNRKSALMFFIICLFTTPLYLYCAEYYTDTFSMLTTVLLFYLWIVRDTETKLPLKLIRDIIYGVVLFVAIKLKLTSAFVFIAIILYELVQGEYKKLFSRMVTIVPITAILMVLFNVIVVNKLATKEMRWINEIPKEHWIMMGMNGVGNFSGKEYAYTNSLENRTFPQKQQADRKMIKERLTTRTINQHIKNLNGKLAFAWHDGTYWVPDVLRREPISRGKLHEYVLEGGANSKYYKYVPQIMHFSMLIFIFANLCRIIKEKNWNSKEIIPIITMFGLMLFLLIWENRSRYLVNILPLMIMSELNGIDYLSKKIKIGGEK